MRDFAANGRHANECQYDQADLVAEIAARHTVILRTRDTAFPRMVISSTIGERCVMKRAPAYPELAHYRAPNLRYPTPAPTPSNRWFRLLLINTLLVSAVCLAAVALFVVSDEWTTDSDVGAPGVPAEVQVVSQWRVSAFEPSRRLQSGDTVVVHREGESAVQQVAATANEAVLLKRGSVLQGLYMAGPKSCVVISDGTGKIVDKNEIIATVAPARERRD